MAGKVYVVTAPDGKDYEIEAPAGATEQQALDYFKQNWKPAAASAPAAPALQPAQPQSWGEVGSRAVGNLLPSTGAAFSGLAHSVLHPIDTASTLYNIGKGSFQNVTGLGSDTEAQNVADAVNKFYKQRYTTKEGFKEAVASDPAGVLLDFSTLVGGAGGLAKVGGLAKTGEVLGKTASAIDPMANALRLGKVAAPVPLAVGKQIVGVKTGAGPEALSEAYKAGKAGGQTAETFTANMRGNVPVTQVLEDAKTNLSVMNKAKQDQYRSGMVDITADKKALDFAGIDKAISNAENLTTFKGQTKNPKAAEKLQEVRTEIENWKKLDPAEYHTPEGMDALKQKIGGILEDIPYEQKTTRKAVGDVYNSVKNEISKQAPTYAKVMKDYAEASELMTEIERTLSLNPKASVDTSMRKLQSIMRNNVNTNFGNRLDLVREMEQAGGKEIVPALAGQTLNTWAPRGSGRFAAAPTSVLSYGVGGLPLAAADLVASSPRLMGETAYGAGRLAGALRKGGDVIGAYSPQALKNIDPRVLANVLYQLNQPKGQQ